MCGFSRDLAPLILAQEGWIGNGRAGAVLAFLRVSMSRAELADPESGLEQPNVRKA